MVGVEILGLEQMVKQIGALIDALDEQNRQATVANIAEGVAYSVTIAPYKTGTLRRSVAGSVARYPVTMEDHVVVGQWGSDLPYAGILEHGGTIPAHTVHNLFGKGITANIPAQSRTARPYLFPSLVANINHFVTRYQTAYQRAEEQVGKSA